MCMLPLAEGILEEPWDWESALRTVKMLYAAWNNTINTTKQRELGQLKRKCVLASWPANHDVPLPSMQSCHVVRKFAQLMCCWRACHGLCHAKWCAMPTCSIIFSVLCGTVAPARASCSLSLQQPVPEVAHAGATTSLSSWPALQEVCPG